MPHITLESTLHRHLEQVAQAVAQSPEQIVTRAISDRLRELELQLLEVEMAAYERLHPQLKQTHLGQFVAIHGGELVDSDAELESLHGRVRARLGSQVVHIRKVEETPLQEFHFHSVRVQRD